MSRAKKSLGTSRPIWRAGVASEKNARDMSGHGELMPWAKKSLVTSPAIWGTGVASGKIARGLSGPSERLSPAKKLHVASPAIWRAHVASEKIAHVNGSERSRAEEFPSEEIARDIGLYNLMGMGRERKNRSCKRSQLSPPKSLANNSLVTSHRNLARKCC